LKASEAGTVGHQKTLELGGSAFVLIVGRIIACSYGLCPDVSGCFGLIFTYHYGLFSMTFNMKSKLNPKIALQMSLTPAYPISPSTLAKITRSQP